MIFPETCRLKTKKTLPQPSEDREKSVDAISGSDDEGTGEKKEKKKAKKAKKVVKKKDKKEKEPSPPKLKLDMGDSKPKVSKAKMFEQSQKEEKPLGESKKVIITKWCSTAQ